MRLWVYLLLAVNVLRASPTNTTKLERSIRSIEPNYELAQNWDSISKNIVNDVFPDDFLFGVATAAYQVEGAWNVSGKGESIWDHLTHNRPELISDQSNGDVATDSYHKYAEDIQLVRQLGANAYRISLSWTRILPNGFANRVNPDGIRYYNDVINEMLKYGIQPMVTLYHWDLPQRLQELGGWTNPYIVDWFEAYARVAFNAFGDRVKLWATVNEPTVICGLGYADFFAPAINQSGIADYMCGHHLLLSHARVYHMYNREFRAKQNGKVGMVETLGWFEPANPISIADVAAAEATYQFNSGWFTHAIYSAQGDYPLIMKNRVKAKSQQQGYPASRLLSFTAQQIEELRGAADFLGLNFYTAKAIRNKTYGYMCREDDIGAEEIETNAWGESVSWVKNTPWALSKLINRINSEFSHPDIYITENGYADFGGTRDIERTVYHHVHLQAVALAIQSGVNIKGYFAWSLLDNFEWLSGYDIRFGLHEVDFTDPNRTRTPKMSSKLISDIYTTKQIPELLGYITK